MRISDWSSDVCSSDLDGALGCLRQEAGFGHDDSPCNAPLMRLLRKVTSYRNDIPYPKWTCGACGPKRNVRLRPLAAARRSAPDRSGAAAAPLRGRCRGRRGTRWDERRVGEECVSKSRSGVWPYKYKRKYKTEDTGR